MVYIKLKCVYIVNDAVIEKKKEKKKIYKYAMNIEINWTNRLEIYKKKKKKANEKWKRDAN